jgi:spermidine/putrescine transport system ATP-binding protein
LRDHLLEELRQILHESGIPAIYVTHDQEEAFAIADRIALLHDGQIEQIGAPAEVFAHPVSGWVANFLGLGNVLEGKLVDGGRVETKLGVLDIACERGAGTGESVALLVRPEGVQLSSNTNGLKGRVADVLFQKNGYRVTLENGLYFYTSRPVEAGETVTFTLEAECLG